MTPRLAVILFVFVSVLPLRADEPSAEEQARMTKEMIRLSQEGHQLSGAEKYREAMTCFEEALALCGKLYPESKYPDGHIDTANCINNVGLQLYLLGSHQKALPYFERALAMKRKLYPESKYPDGHPALALGLYNLGSLYDNLGQSDKALASLEESLVMKRKLYPESKYPDGHPELYAGLSALGALLNSLGECEKSLGYYERALVMVRKLYPESKYPNSHPEVIRTLNNLGVVRAEMGSPDQALPHFEQALAALRTMYPAARFPDGHPGIARHLDNLGTTLTAMGQYEKALASHDEALAMNRKLFPPSRFPDGHPAVAQSLGHRIIALKRMGRCDEALPVAEEAVAMRRALYPESRYPNGHPDLVRGLNSLAGILAHTGHLEQAVRLLEQAVAMNEALFPKALFPNGHKDLALGYNNLGSLYRDIGANDKALRYHERAYTIYQQLYAPAKYPNGHPNLARCLNNLGLVESDLGAHEKALQRHGEALAICRRLYPESKYPEGHPELATRHHNLALALESMGALEKALPHHQAALAQSLKIYPESRYPRGHPDVANAQRQLGRVLHRLGTSEKALPFAERALTMTRRLYPESLYPAGHPDLAGALNDLGGALRDAGDYEKARLVLEEAVGLCRKLYPPARYPGGHEFLAMTVSNAGSLFLSMGKNAAAEAHYKQSLEVFHKLIDRDVATAPEAQALALVRPMRLTLNAYLSAVPADQREEEVYLSLWRAKALATRVLEQRHAAARTAGTELDDKRNRLRQLHGEIERTLQSPQFKPEERDRKIADLGDERDRLERALAAALPALERWRRRDRLGPEVLSGLLPPDAAFIDFLSYMRFKQNPAKKGEAGETRIDHYVAFVLTPGRPIQRIELGDRAPIDAAVTEWRQAIETRKENSAGDTLRRLVWAPIAKRLPRGTRTLYLSPDGDLARIPWCALPGSNPGTVLLEEFAGGLGVVPHGPFLLEYLKYPPKDSGGKEAVLALGGVAYDPSGTPTGSVRYPFLRGTLSEVESVRARAGDRPVLALTDATATAARLLAELPKARYAHLATHGFFAAEKLSAERRRQQDLLRDWDFQTERETPRLVAGENPLAYTGLVLAGANQPSERDSGIITGLRIVDLPLENLKLVTLSACETGLGASTAAEGVFGLQRAFHLAGCPNVVASLWNVNDAATAALMARFYHELWTNKKPSLEALREAQLTIYRRPDLIADLAGERGAPKFKEAVAVKATDAKPQAAKTADTKLWAAFVLSGVGK